jgi:hypothetical protein
MRELVDNILNDRFVEANSNLTDRINEIFESIIDEIKLKVASEFSIDESNVYKMGREKSIRLRIRKGKVQRRVVKSTTPGYIERGGRLTRMSPQERRHRKMGQRTAKFKRRHALQQTIRKRKVALKRRKALGV